MERSSKLADLKLVSKYYPITPVANYSYPHPERQSQYGRRRGHISDDRSSLGSEGSAPGLIDDRTDSEVSLDDDYQYHAHAAELWDSFWQPSPEAKEKDQEIELQPRKQYPALIPSPQTRRRRGLEERRGPAWPLPDSPQPRNRKPAATYSPFPKPITLPPRTTSLVPSWQGSRPVGKPKRPPRPDDELLTACVQQLSPIAAHFAASPEADKIFYQSVTPAEPQPAEPQPTEQGLPMHQPTRSVEIRPVTPAESKPSIYSIASRSATHLPSPGSKPLPPVMLSKKSLPCLLRPVKLEPEPHSVFEWDDSDSEAESPTRSFFRFHKRGGSGDTRHKSSDPSGRRHRTRASTAPSSPDRGEPRRPSKHEMPARLRQGGDVIGRMLGRRSR
ncbi:Fc.00g037370.m01.CDS01 [Cosmosporella sp. VM-42]